MMEDLREELIRLRVKNSQLDSQKEMLEKEQKMLDVSNKKLKVENDKLEKENEKYISEIQVTIQKIDINYLLKDVDMEEYKLITETNKSNNFLLQNMLTKWNFVLTKPPVVHTTLVRTTMTETKETRNEKNVRDTF
jgi:hypothetical protein